MDTTVHTETTEYKGIQQVIDNVHCWRPRGLQHLVTMLYPADLLSVWRSVNQCAVSLNPANTGWAHMCWLQVVMVRFGSVWFCTIFGWTPNLTIGPVWGIFPNPELDHQFRFREGLNAKLDPKDGMHVLCLHNQKIAENFLLVYHKSKLLGYKVKANCIMVSTRQHVVM